MVTLDFLFWIFVILFAIIGAMRGWAQELLVSFSIILSLFIFNVLQLVPVVQTIIGPGFVNEGGAAITGIGETAFWVRTLLLVVFTFFGYQTPRVKNERIRKAATRSDRLQDTILGIIVGAFNGYLIFGTIWFFLIQADYFLKFVEPPTPDNESAALIIRFLAPTMLSGNRIYFAIAIAFAFVVIVFI